MMTEAETGFMRTPAEKDASSWTRQRRAPSRAFGGSVALPTPRFGLLVSGTVRERISPDFVVVFIAALRNDTVT